MLAIFRALTDRLKALFISTVALDCEAEFVGQQAERKAELLRRATHYENEGLLPVAQELRAQANGLSLQRPLASVLPAIGHLQAEPAALLLTQEAANAQPAPTPATKKKGRG